MVASVAIEGAPRRPQAQPALDVLATHGRSFRFAGRFLARTDLIRAARLYAFCRHIDDLADETTAATLARERLDAIEHDLCRGTSANAVVRDFRELVDETDLDFAVVRQLLLGIRSDLADVEIAQIDDLLRYAYRVAGTVGLMMCAVLGTTDRRALPHAIDLGMAMQLTNVARDVCADAIAGRRYLPAEVVGNVSPRIIAADPKQVGDRLRSGVAWLLRQADRYYVSGEAGLAYLAPRPRLAILVAARTYRAIGSELARRGHAPWLGRAIVPMRHKLRHAAAATVDLARRRDLWVPTTGHDARLHRAIAGLPGTNCAAIHD